MTSPVHEPVPLTAEAIVDAALVLAEEHGLAALSMRRLATALGRAPMTLYGHVESKDALLALMAEYGLASLPEPDPGAPWPAELTRFFTAFYDLLQERPVVTQVMVERPVSSPQLTRRGEQIIECLTAGGVGDEAAVDALLTLTWFTLGAAQYANARTDRTSAADRFADLPDDEHPTLKRVAPRFAGDARREQFRTGLTHLIRGYERT